MVALHINDTNKQTKKSTKIVSKGLTWAPEWVMVLFTETEKTEGEASLEGGGLICIC